VSEEKSEKPTQKKLRDARKKGQVSKSKDITQALLFLTAVGVLAAGGPRFVTETKHLIVDSLQPRLLTGQLRLDEILHHAGYTWGRLLLFTAPFLAAVAIVAAAGNFFQVSALFAPEAVQFKLEKLNFVKNFQNIFFKPKTYLELLKTLIKLAIVGTLAYMAVRSSLRDIILSARANPETTGRLAVSLMFNFLINVGILFLIIGAADFFLQKKLFMKEMMMSKYEVKKEHKEEQGDPHIRHSRRHMHQQLQAQSMVQNVPKADVVVVNPTHLAIAVQYDDATMNAPAVTAKGQANMAQRIIKLANESGVPITRNIPLAHGLFQVELGQEIPEELYDAVAEVLNWVYHLAQAERV
jgi:type III secretion YscU/HrpY family protein